MSDTLTTKPDRALSTSQVGERLSIHRRDVCRLIAEGDLHAKQLRIRGNGGRPRYRVLESELQRYIAGMVDAVARPSGKRPAQPRRTRPRVTPTADVVEFV